MRATHQLKGALFSIAALNARQDTQLERTLAILDQAAPGVNAPQTREMLLQAGRAANKPAYARAYLEGEKGSVARGLAAIDGGAGHANGDPHRDQGRRQSRLLWKGSGHRKIHLCRLETERSLSSRACGRRCSSGITSSRIWIVRSVRLSARATIRGRVI